MQLLDGASSQRLIRSLSFLVSCGYAMPDIILVLAHTSEYYSSIRTRAGGMESKETVNVLMVLMFIAHTFVLDHHCMMRTWHKYLFKDYCTLPTLERAAISLLKLRDYRLKLTEDTLEARVSEICAPA
jgi:hypothetical protein